MNANLRSPTMCDFAASSEGGDRRTNMSTFSPYARRVCHTTRRELEEAIACISTVYRATFVGTGLALGRKKIPSHIAVRFFSERCTMHKTTFETTVGDLIVALTDETHQQVRDEKITYKLVAYILADLMKNSRRAR